MKIMYMETYHPLQGENLKDLLRNLTEDQKKVAMEQIESATKNKTRNYRITIVPPNADDGKGGIWFDIENGIIKESSNQ